MAAKTDKTEKSVDKTTEKAAAAAEGPTPARPRLLSRRNP